MFFIKLQKYVYIKTVETLIKDRQQEYYSALESSDNQADSTVFIEFIVRAIRDELKGGLKNKEQLTDRQIEIVNYILVDETITKKKLANKVGINPSAIQKHLAKLKKLGVLERIGGKRGGHWKVLLK